MKKFNGFISVVLVLLLVLGMVPVQALAAEPAAPDYGSIFESDGPSVFQSGAPDQGDPVTAVVRYTCSSGGVFLCPPVMSVEVSSDLAETNGYTDGIPSTEGVSALDVLVRAHIAIFGSCEGVLTVSDTGLISVIFGEATSANGFMRNGMYPHDGTPSQYGGYNGTMINTTPAKTGDTFHFFIYQDTASWGDHYAWFTGNGIPLGSVQTAAGETHTFGIDSASIMSGYLYENASAFYDSGAPLAGAQVGWVDMTTGEIIPCVVSDQNGKFTITMPNDSGVHYLCATVPADAANPIVCSVLPVHIVAPQPGSVSVSYTAQAAGDFIVAPRTPATVSGDLSDQYGFDDQIPATEVSALDVLIQAHLDIFGTTEGMLEVPESGFITTMFGQPAAAGGFFLNGAYPNDGTASSFGGYNGTTVTTQSVTDGDHVEFFLYQDTAAYGDHYSWFRAGETVPQSVDGICGMPLTLELMSVPVMNGYLYKNAAEMHAAGQPVPAADLGFVNMITGEITPIPEKISQGSVTLTLPQEPGTYCLTAQTTGNPPLIRPLLQINVGALTDEAAVKLVQEEFAKYGSFRSALVFPVTFEGTDYLSAPEYMKAWAKKNLGRDLTVSFTAEFTPTQYKEWNTGTLVEKSYPGMDIDGNIIQDYFKDNKEKILLKLTDVTFQIGKSVSEPIKTIFMKARSLQRTPREIVDYVAENMCFARIQGKNPSADRIITTLGEASGASVALPRYTDLYTSTTVDTQWSVKPVSGREDALTIGDYGKDTVLRPNVGQEDARVDLIARVISKTDPQVNREVIHHLTVPAMEGIVVPIQVTKGAALTVTDPYYGGPVDASYVEKQATAPDGYDLYHVTLHKGPTGEKQKYTWQLTRKGYITASGSFDVEKDTPDTLILDLTPSGKKDTQLAGLEIREPQIPGFTFDPDVAEYTVEVSGVQYLRIAGTPAVAQADARITKYYTSVKNANSGTLATGSKALTDRGISCYLPDEVSESTIEITVTAPDGSTQEPNFRVYVIHVKKIQPTGPVSRLSLSAQSTLDGTLNNFNADFGVPDEEELCPSFVPGGHEALYTYHVNYWRDQVKLLVGAPDAVIKLNGREIASSTYTEPIALNVGDNLLEISVTKGEEETLYKVNVHRKNELRITDVTLPEGELLKPMPVGAPDWTGSCSFLHGSAKLHVTFHTSLPEDLEKQVTVKVVDGNAIHTGVAGQPMELPVGDRETAMTSVWLLYTAPDGTVEGQRYVISFRRQAFEGPSNVASYLPAPGQFVNVPAYQNPGDFNGLTTLGAFGGNVVYQYEEPIRNDPRNPYGIDFIIYGNAFTNSDGTSAAGAAEPATVMVSSDGTTWYELAGSEYYNADTRHGITLTYRNPDPSFTKAVDIPWTDSQGGTGTIPKNDFHDQAYYPNPAYYGSYQAGVGRNDSYTETSVSFTGSMLHAQGFYPFGYADTHAAGTTGAKAANPYTGSHSVHYNGDGFDLDWAVDASGNPVHLDSVRYIKIYNPVLSYGGATGEASPEINRILRAEPASEDVGTTQGLTALTVNGKNVKLEDGAYTYTVSTKGASSLTVTPTAENASIYVGNQFVPSGEASQPMAITAHTRIIVQEGSKAPAVYMLNLTDQALPEENADLLSLKLTPGDLTDTPDGDDCLYFAVPDSVSSVRLTPTAGHNKAALTLTAKGMKPQSLSQGKPSEPLTVAEGENRFTLTVTSPDGSVKKIYTVLITRAAAPEETDMEVFFELVGDTKHYDQKARKYTARHKDQVWISRRAVQVPVDSTALYVAELMLNNAGIPYVLENGYLSEIRGLAEFDNGPNSGWMYTVNGKLPNVGLGAKKLNPGDSVRLYFTDDYINGNYDGPIDETDEEVEKVIELIDKIRTPVDLSQKDAVKAARKAYDSLTSDQKKQVTNYKKLTDAEYTLDHYQTVPADDQAQADKVMDLIRNIGTVTDKSGEAIEKARKAYNSLTSYQKGLVTNLDTLVTAENLLKQLQGPTHAELYKRTGDYLQKQSETTEVDSVGGEWLVLGLARSGRPVPETYLQTALKYIGQNADDLDRLHKVKSTDNSRLILALTALNQDVTALEGHDLLRGLADLDYVTGQGINGPIWALIALDSARYPIPKGGTTTRDALVTAILDRQLKDGGWALSGDKSDPDLTAMALLSLAPYVEKTPVERAVQKAVDLLSDLQNDNGTYGSRENCESTAQVAIALTAQGIDPETDRRFVKSGCSVMDGLALFAETDGSFRHTASSDPMATEQAYLALTAYHRFLDRETALFDMTDVIVPEVKDYKLLSGADSYWQQGSEDTVVLTVDAPFEDFLSVRVDGKELASTDYSVTEGSTVITLNPAYLETLTPGAHTVKIFFEGAEVMTTLTIQRAPANLPQEQTEEPSHTGLYVGIALLVLAAAAAVLLIVYRKKIFVNKDKIFEDS